MDLTAGKWPTGRAIGSMWAWAQRERGQAGRGAHGAPSVITTQPAPLARSTQQHNCLSHAALHWHLIPVQRITHATLQGSASAHSKTLPGIWYSTQPHWQYMPYSSAVHTYHAAKKVDRRLSQARRHSLYPREHAPEIGSQGEGGGRRGRRGLVQDTTYARRRPPHASL